VGAAFCPVAGAASMGGRPLLSLARIRIGMCAPAKNHALKKIANKTIY
jgi:hypothetical protein